MWHIIAIGYLFVAVLFSAAQPTIARALIYLVFWAVLPSLFTFWVVKTRRRNKRIKWLEKQQSSRKPE
ncbi:hypothetical protein [Neisseria zoodegmatis]|uniref:Integral membrane protein n=1 Tax=Neisseria zoodegmatis TaxID=326523 RepID=A0AB38DP66_9NEIS|nr:hypothetical protein [Neisseria zoodegmatis]OSI09974.1 hypothetical protein BWD10_07190 [Neisseria zoodegmatis]SNU79014.1 integral membrane protein [Neisseria zoodegmatis]